MSPSSSIILRESQAVTDSRNRGAGHYVMRLKLTIFGAEHQEARLAAITLAGPDGE